FKLMRWLRYEFRQLKTYSYGNSQVKEGKHVIAYEPSWLIYDSLYLNYPFELLSDMIIGEYDVNPASGFARNDSAVGAFRNKDIVEVGTAVNGDLNVLMAVTDYGDFGYRTKFLGEVAKKNLINSLDLILDEMNTKRDCPEERPKLGVVMDFPNVTRNLRKDYAEFMSRLNKDLDNREQNKQCLIYCVVPADDPYEMYKDSIFATAMVENVDLFILRAHKFTNIEENPGAHGAMVPMIWPKQVSLDSAVRYYTDHGFIPKSKLAVEIPYYGRKWVNDSVMDGVRPLIPLSEIVNINEDVAKRQLDTNSLSWYKTIEDTTYFYEDTLSLNVKYDWIARQGLAGVSLYGTGYGHALDDTKMEFGLWQTVANHFAEPSPRLLFASVGFLLCFFGLGIIVSVVGSWEVRHALREKMGKFWYYLGLLTCMIIATICCVLPVNVVPIIWKLLSLALLLIFPLGRRAFRWIFRAAR
ncbi:MAG: glycoside hydrolase family 18 protein, partial [Bacteroidota bacterium]